jgi:hypothetical protein
VDFADGESLTLLPVAEFGQRDIGFPTPRGLDVTRVTVYAANSSVISYEAGIPNGNGPSCVALGMAPANQLLSGEWAQGGPTVMFNELNARVDHLVVALSDGRSIRVEPVSVGGRHFGALVVGKGIQVRSITSYDSSGHQLAQETTGLPGS